MCFFIQIIKKTKIIPVQRAFCSKAVFTLETDYTSVKDNPSSKSVKIDG